MARERAPQRDTVLGWSAFREVLSANVLVGCWNHTNCIKLLCSLLFIDYQYCLFLWSILMILMGEANNKLFEKETLSNFTRMACRNIPTWKFLIGFTTFCWPGSLSSGAHHHSPPQGAAPEEHSKSHQPTAVTWVAYITMRKLFLIANHRNCAIFGLVMFGRLLYMFFWGQFWWDIFDSIPRNSYRVPPQKKHMFSGCDRLWLW